MEEFVFRGWMKTLCRVVRDPNAGDGG